MWWENTTTSAYYQGFVSGFLDNPYTTGKDALNTIVGISNTALKVTWMTSPLGVMWEFTFGDRYEGEIKAAIQAARRAKEIVSQTYQVLQECGPEVFDFLWKLQSQVGDALEQLQLQTTMPGMNELGPELRFTLEAMRQVLFMADDAWVGMSPYERGYWQGYIAFEIFIVVVCTVLTAQEGGVGGPAVLARHVPKLKRVFDYIVKLLDKLSDVPGLGKLVNKIKNFLQIAKTVTREAIMLKVDDLFDTSVIRQLDPDALVGYRGSLAAGFKYDKVLKRFDKPFNPQSFDVDAFIVSDKLASQINLTKNWRDGGKIPDIKQLQNKLTRLMRMQPEFAGLKPGRDGNLTFRVFSKAEWKRYGKTPFKLFTK